MIFADLHRHILPGLDDGASSEEEMRCMLDEAYADGVRLLCATPHYHPGFFSYTKEALLTAFESLKAYAAQVYPDLVLCLGAELRYAPSAPEWLAADACRTLGGSRYVLVDFLQNERADVIMGAMRNLLNAGYLPVLAHVERYDALKTPDLAELKRMGVVLQLDAGSFFGEWGAGARRRAKSAVRHGLADLVASDAHHPNSPVTLLEPAYQLVARLSNQPFADALFYQNANHLLAENTAGKE